VVGSEAVTSTPLEVVVRIWSDGQLDFDLFVLSSKPKMTTQQAVIQCLMFLKPFILQLSHKESVIFNLIMLIYSSCCTPMPLVTTEN